MLVIDGNSEDDRQTEDKFREVNYLTDSECLSLMASTMVKTNHEYRETVCDGSRVQQKIRSRKIE
jgi:hypothetical protein